MKLIKNITILMILAATPFIFQTPKALASFDGRTTDGIFHFIETPRHWFEKSTVIEIAAPKETYSTEEAFTGHMGTVFPKDLKLDLSRRVHFTDFPIAFEAFSFINPSSTCQENLILPSDISTDINLWHAVSGIADDKKWYTAYRQQPLEWDGEQADTEVIAIAPGSDSKCYVVIADTRDTLKPFEPGIWKNVFRGLRVSEEYYLTTEDLMMLGRAIDPKYYFDAIGSIIFSYAFGFADKNSVDTRAYREAALPIADIYFRQHQYQKAIDFLEEANRFDELAPEPLFGMGLGYHLLGQSRIGDQYLKQAFKKQTGIFNLSTNPNAKTAFENFKNSFFDKYNKDTLNGTGWENDKWEVVPKGELWSEWIKEYDFKSVPRHSVVIDSFNTSSAKPSKKTIDTSAYNNVGKFHDGYAIAHRINRNTDHGWILIDEKGNPASADLGEIINYKKTTILGSTTRGYYGSIVFFNFKVEPAFPELKITGANWFVDGIAAVRDEFGNNFYIDQSGKTLNNKFYTGIGDFKDGLATVKTLEGQAYHLTSNGTRLYSSNYDYVGDFEGPYAIARQDGYWFHINRKGERLYPFNYLSVTNFNGPAAIAKDGYGFFHIDQKGNPFYSARYTFVSPFQDGLASALTDGGNTIFINERGKPIMRGVTMLNRNSDLVLVKDHNGEYFHIRSNGKRLYKDQYALATPFEYTIESVWNIKKRERGLQETLDSGNDNGTLKIEANFDWRKYEKGRSVAIVQDFQGYFYVINRDGERLFKLNETDAKIIRKPQKNKLLDKMFTWVGESSDGLYAVETKGGKWLHVDSLGNKAYAEKFEWVGDYAEGFAIVKIAPGKFAHIDRSGKRLYEQTYPKIYNFINGIALVETDDIQFPINTKGKRIIPENVRFIRNYSEGLAVVLDSQGNQYHIDSKAQRPYTQNYQRALSFNEGRAIVQDFEGNWFYIDKKGKVMAGNPLQSLVVYWGQAVGPGKMPCPEMFFGESSSFSPECQVMEKDQRNSIQR